MAGSVAVGIVLSLLSSGVERGRARDPVQVTGMLPLLGYDRDQERAADDEARATVAAVYGHVGGAHAAERARSRNRALDRRVCELPPARAKLKPAKRTE